jgi:23S rRNA G2445 N2-methylase RlmL
VIVTFATAFRRHVDCPDEEVTGATSVGEALGEYFRRHPGVRSYVVDDTGQLRRHVTVFSDDVQLNHREALHAPVRPTTTVHVFQALSGG